mmetsp:Transcript_59011/g.120897  ORF Transcript_59011/g.120897 Transcript_59011/m.120897 type:complete len:323 (+) Transcript_59011:166-1134(+)|eukprot:CAMPEP_0181296200 /NCGR_PEP_ID=MMETSP1101-20121128/4569_1 /TAXON_ID=46948 /ORGANISM="Rhodomonas abbreviata, Strain Caron Lab Isolate" /LENGTH=322 /DNA_ID=CAMNT_0023401033 /DNA_START=165 /DNA_END=1133 /DNA_ORIENTATION=+
MRLEEEEAEENKKRREGKPETTTATMQVLHPQAFKDSFYALKDSFAALAAQWVVAIAFIAIAGVVNKIVPPHIKLIPPYPDPSMSYPVGQEQVPEAMVLIIAGLLPIIVICVVAHCTDRADVGGSILALFQSLSYNMLATVVMKKLAGRPRPCFYAMCEWVETNSSAIGMIGMETGVCTGPEKSVWEARQSFPSGHSSVSFSGLAFLSLFLLEKLAQFSRKQQPAPSFGRALQLRLLQLVAASPCVLAAWVAVTRTMDYWHNYDDVVTGAALGTVFAFWFFSQREGYYSIVREDRRLPGAPRNSDEIVPMADVGPSSSELNV